MALYEQVWATPISRLAPSFELSDNGLRKVCKKLHVPTPPRGYWAKLRHGHDVSPAPLPALPEDASDMYVIYRGGVENVEAQTHLTERGSGCASSELDVPPITVSSRLRAPHPLIVQTRDGLKRPFTDQSGPAATRRSSCHSSVQCAPLRTIQKMLGHSDITITARTYADVMTDAARRQVQAAFE